MNELDKILEERGKEYGSFESHARLTQSLKCQMFNADGWGNLLAVHREALEMIAHKIGRILNGNCNNIDSWHDIAGYAELVVKELKKEIKNA